MADASTSRCAMDVSRLYLLWTWVTRSFLSFSAATSAVVNYDHFWMMSPRVPEGGVVAGVCMISGIKTSKKKEKSETT